MLELSEMNDSKRHQCTCTVSVCLAPPIAQVRMIGGAKDVYACTSDRRKARVRQLQF